MFGLNPTSPLSQNQQVGRDNSGHPAWHWTFSDWALVALGGLKLGEVRFCCDGWRQKMEVTLIHEALTSIGYLTNSIDLSVLDIYADHFQYNDTSPLRFETIASFGKPGTVWNGSWPRPARCIHIPPWVKPCSNVPWTTTAPRGPNWAVRMRPENTWAMNEISGGFRKMLAGFHVYTYVYIYTYVSIYVFMWLFILLFMCLFVYVYIYMCVCVCFHGKIDKYDDVWWFSRKPYLISGGYGTKWNVLVAIIQHQMQEKFSWTRTASVTSYYRFNKMESSPGKAVPLNQTCLGHIWTSCVWQAGYKS